MAIVVMVTVSVGLESVVAARWEESGSSSRDTATVETDGWLGS